MLEAHSWTLFLLSTPTPLSLPVRPPWATVRTQGYLLLAKCQVLENSVWLLLLSEERKDLKGRLPLESGSS